MEQKTIGKSKEDYLKAILIVLKEHGAYIFFGLDTVCEYKKITSSGD